MTVTKTGRDTALDTLMAAVRTYIRDLPGLSKRYEGSLVFTPDDLKFALAMATDRINSIPPISSYTPETVPYRNWVIRMAALNLADTRLAYLERETVVAQDAGGILAKAEELPSLQRRLLAMTDLLIKEITSGKAAVQLQGYLTTETGIASVYGGGFTWEG
jgi:hypothetical protein